MVGEHTVSFGALGERLELTHRAQSRVNFARGPARGPLHRDGPAGALLMQDAGARMRIVRFRAGGKIRYGVLEGQHIVEYAGTPYGTFKKARKKYLQSQAVLLAPVPTKIVGGLNYREHAEEMNVQVPAEPQISSSRSVLCGPDD